MLQTIENEPEPLHAQDTKRLDMTYAVRELVSMLSSPSQDVRTAAGHALSRIGREADPARLELRRLLADTTSSISCLAGVAEAVGLLGISEAAL